MLKLALLGKERFNPARRIYDKANYFLARGQSEPARQFYLKLITMKESGDLVNREIYADILHNLGMIAENNRQYDLAINYYRQVIAASSKHRMTWLFLARAYLDRFQREADPADLTSGGEAIKEAEKAGLSFPALRYLKKKYRLA